MSEAERRIDEGQQNGYEQRAFNHAAEGHKFPACGICVPACGHDPHQCDDDFGAFPCTKCRLHAGYAAQNADADIPEQGPPSRPEHLFDAFAVLACHAIDDHDKHGQHTRDNFFNGCAFAHVILNWIERPRKRRQKEHEPHEFVQS